MWSRRHLLLIVLAGLAATGIFWSCDRMEGDVNANQLPVVQFVNVPLDSSRFSYAPTVYWFGYDPDGMITGYQYVDDQSEAAVQAYEQDAANPGTLLAYINSLPPSAWTTTENTQETIYLLTTEGDTAQHVFVVRAVDDQGAYSIPKVRIFFRTNQAPRTPEIKKLSQDRWEEEQDYGSTILLNDTLFIGDAPGLTWPGIQFVWKGTDPDSRELNIIPLEFSYLLVNETTGRIMPFPRQIDSTHFEWVHDWSDWSDNAQVRLSQLNTNGEMETGNYRFELRVRDDGLTLSDTNAVVRFYAIRPTFEKQLLIVDENRPLAGPDAVRGGLSDSTILAFYYNVLPQAFQLAEMVRPFVDDNRDGRSDIPEPFVYDTSAGGQVHWFRNKNLASSIPLSLIHQYKWVWVIDDDNYQATLSDANITERQKAMGWYMNVGGGVMISGRRIFNGSYNIPNGDVNACTNSYGRFFCEYFDLETIRAKQPFSASDQVPGNNVADFGGAGTANPTLPDVSVNAAVVCSLRFGSNRFCCLPEVDFFGRSTSSTGYDFSETLYNYNSCTGGLADSVRNLDGQIVSSTPTQAIIYPDTLGTPPGARHQRIIEVTRVYNRTREVPGEVMGLRFNSLSGRWEIVVSTPVGAGQWVDSDVLEVDYTFIPIAINDDKPVAARFIRIQGIVDVDFDTGDFQFIGETRFRSAIFTFPLSLLDPTPVTVPAFEQFGAYPPAAAIVATQLLFFNSLDRFVVGRDNRF